MHDPLVAFAAFTSDINPQLIVKVKPFMSVIDVTYVPVTACAAERTTLVIVPPA